MEHLRTHSYCWECNYSPENEKRASIRKKLDDELFFGRNFQENEIEKNKDVYEIITFRNFIK